MQTDIKRGSHHRTSESVGLLFRPDRMALSGQDQEAPATNPFVPVIRLLHGSSEPSLSAVDPADYKRSQIEPIKISCEYSANGEDQKQLHHHERRRTF